MVFGLFNVEKSKSGKNSFTHYVENNIINNVKYGYYRSRNYKFMG